MPTSTEILVLCLAASLLAGGFFLLAALRPPRATRPESRSHEQGPIYWPLLLGTGQRTFDTTMRMEIINQLATEPGDWRVPILLCAREQESEPEFQAAIARALGPTGRPVIAAPRMS